MKYLILSSIIVGCLTKDEDSTPTIDTRNDNETRFIGEWYLAEDDFGVDGIENWIFTPSTYKALSVYAPDYSTDTSYYKFTGNKSSNSALSDLDDL